MSIKQIFKILHILAVAFILIFGTSFVFISGDHYCADCVQIYAICPCPAKRAEQQFAQATEPFAVPLILGAPLIIALHQFLREQSPVDLKVRMDN